jgi:uncharacterized protein
VTDTKLHDRFTRALEALIAEIREDRSILAAMLCGSLSHDAVWKHSDIDLVLIAIDDKKVDAANVSLDADGLNVHAMVMPRAQFKKLAEGSVRNSFMHSLLAKGRLLYSHDASIEQMCESLRDIGARDAALQVFRAATSVLPMLYKAHKFFATRRDLYSLLHVAVDFVRRHATCSSGGDAGTPDCRPGGDPTSYETEPRPVSGGVCRYAEWRTNRRKGNGGVNNHRHIHGGTCFGAIAPLLEYLHETGEARSVTELDAHFARTLGVEHVSTACEYLADLGLIAKVSITRQLTRRSNVGVQEQAFVLLGNRT